MVIADCCTFKVCLTYFGSLSCLDAVQDSRPHQNNCLASKDATKDVAERDGAVAANGVPSSASRCHLRGNSKMIC